MKPFLPICAIAFCALPACEMASSLPPEAAARRTAAAQVPTELNAPADAIVGMWYLKYTSSTGAAGTITKLFKADGTGIVRLKSSDDRIATNDKNGSLTWKYSGGGMWTVWMSSIVDPSVSLPAQTFRLTDSASGGKLYDQNGFAYTRVQ